MIKSFLKIAVSSVIFGAVMTISSITAMAAITNLDGTTWDGSESITISSSTTTGGQKTAGMTFSGLSWSNGYISIPVSSGSITIKPEAFDVKLKSTSVKGSGRSSITITENDIEILTTSDADNSIDIVMKKDSTYVIKASGKKSSNLSETTNSAARLDYSSGFVLSKAGATITTSTPDAISAGGSGSFTAELGGVEGVAISSSNTTLTSDVANVTATLGTIADGVATVNVTVGSSVSAETAKITVKVDTDNDGTADVSKDVDITILQPSLTLSKSAISLKPGETETVTATIENIEGGITSAVSSNTDAAAVTYSGNDITVSVPSGASAAENAATITITAGSKTATITVTVLDPLSAETYTLIGNNLSSATLEADENAGTKNMFYVMKGVKNTSNRVQVSGSAYVKIKAKTNGTLNVNGFVSANNTDDTRKLIIAKDGTVLNEFNADKTTKADSGNIALVAGSTYEIKGYKNINIDEITVSGILEQIPITTIDVKITNSTSKPAVITVTGEGTSTYYAVALMSIPSDSITNGVANVTAKIYQEGENEIEISSAYKSVRISGNTYAGNDLGGNSGHYLYAVEINADSVTSDDIPTYIQENVKVSATVNSAS